MVEKGRPGYVIVDCDYFVPPALAEEIQRAGSREEEQILFEKVSKGFLARNTRGDNPLLMTVKSVIEKGEYSINPRTEYKPFLDTLMGSPDFFVGSVRDEVKSGRQKGVRYHHFIRTSNLELAVEALKNNHELDKFKEKRVKVLGDFPDIKPPTTTKIMKCDGYVRVGDVCRANSVPFSHGARVKPEELLAKPPVPVYTDNHGRFFVDEANVGVFGEFVAQRYKQIKPKRKR